MLTGLPDGCQAGSASGPALVGSPGSPWSYRIAGATSSWPAVELYHAGSLVDVVSSTKLAACVLRGATTVPVGGVWHSLAWGRVPLDADLGAVAFSHGRLRTVWQRATPVLVTTWCWVATAVGTFDAVTVQSAGTAIRRRLGVNRSCR